MLGRNDHVHDAGWLTIDILDGDLTLRVGAEPLGRAALAEACEFTAKAVGIHNRRGHELWSLVTRIAEHETLVAGALLGGLLARGLFRIDTLGDVGALRRDDVVDEDGVGMEDIVDMVITDLPDGIADDLAKIESGFEGLILEFGNRDLSTDHDDVALGIGLAGYSAAGI